MAISLEAQRIVLREVRRKFRYSVEKNGSIWVCCPLPEHGGRDSTPSMKINLDPNNKKAPIGHGYCFGCSGRRHWNKFAAEFGLEPIKALDMEVTERSEVAQRLRQVRSGLEELTLQQIAERDFGASMLHPVTSDWRGVSAKLLNLIGGHLIVDGRKETQLLLPVSVHGEMVGAVKAQMDKPTDKSIPTYLNSDGLWAKNLGLFPYDATKQLMRKWKCRKVILSEGPRDALNGLTNRIPTLAILGVKTWTDKKRDLVLSLDPDEVILCMDSDDPGVKATNELMKEFDRYVPVSLVNMKRHAKRAGLDKLDLGEATDAVLTELWGKCYD